MHRVSFFLVTLLFFMWGLITVLNDILIPHLKLLFQLNYTQVMLVQFCFFMAYFISSLPAGRYVKKVGLKKGMVGGLVISGIGTLLFIMAASIKLYPAFLLALFTLASGITLLQVSANPYVTLLSHPSKASANLTLAQAFNSIGTTTGPLVGPLILSFTLQGAYALLSCLLLLMAIFFYKIPLQEKSFDEDSRQILQDTSGSLWDYPHLVFGVLAIFCYVGAEVSIGSFLVSFLGRSEMGGLSLKEAGHLLSFYWGGMLIGRLCGSSMMRFVRPSRVLTFCAVMAVLLVNGAIWGEGKMAQVMILSVGLFNSIMFPTIFSLSLSSLKHYSSAGASFLSMAIVGGAIVPLLQGIMADNVGMHSSFMIPALCYLYIVFYGLKGYQVRERSVGLKFENQILSE